MSADNILIDALKGVNSPYGKRPNEKVPEFLAGMLQSTPDAFSVATTASDEQGMTIQLQINDRKAVINEFNRQLRAGKGPAYFSYLDQLIAFHHKKINCSPPTYEIVLKLYGGHYVLHKSGKARNDLQRKRKSLSPVSCSKRQCSEESSSGYEEPADGEDFFSSQSIQPSTALFINAETGEESLGCGSQEPADNEDLFSFSLSNLFPDLEDLPLSELQEGDAATQTRETMRSDSGIDTESDVQETALKDASATASSSTCYIKPNESSLQGDIVTIICSTLQEDTTYWVTFPDGMGRIEAVCEMSWAGLPCLTIKAPPKEQPGTVVVTIQDLNEQEVNDRPLTLTYVSEKNFPINNSLTIQETRISELWEELKTIASRFQQMQLTEHRNDGTIKKFESAVKKNIKDSYFLDDAIRATCTVLCHASLRAFKGGGIFSACEVESSECRRSAAILGMEPSSSKLIQNIVKTAIEEIWESWNPSTVIYSDVGVFGLHCWPTCWPTFYHIEKVKRAEAGKGSRRPEHERARAGKGSRRPEHERARAGKGSRRLEREQRRQRRVERMKRTGKAGKTGQQI